MASQTVEILAIYYFGAWKMMGRGSDWTCMAGEWWGKPRYGAPLRPLPHQLANGRKSDRKSWI
jgi:hypothetical protein